MSWLSRSRANRYDADAARAVREGLQSRLEVLQRIAARAGARLVSAADDAVPGVPPAVIAGSGTPRAGGEPVRVTSPGVDVIAVLAAAGDPGQWWRGLVTVVNSPAPSAGVVQVPFPAGLLAVAQPGAGGPVVWAASRLAGRSQRAAVQAAVDAGRRAGWGARP